MAVRLKDPPLEDTKRLLELVLLAVVQKDSRALFLTPPGEGEAVLQRLRVMISRKRKELEAEGKRPKRFRLRSTVHPETHEGKRYDACVVWKQVSESNIMSEELGRILSHG